MEETAMEVTKMAFSPANTIWVLLGAALVFFMQAGFAMCEAGFTRAKNTGNILMKNLMDFCIGTPLYWLIGFGIMFGAGTGLFGWIDPFIMKDYGAVLPAGVPLWAYAIFQTVFCATSATIVSGAMAERTKFSAYCLYSAAISLFIYPVSGHWIWGGGFKFLGVQCLGVLSTIGWTAVVITVVFALIKKTIGLRADAADEIMGLDRSEHGLPTAYAGYAMMPDSTYEDAEPAVIAAVAPEKEEAPRKVKEKAPDAPVYTRVQIICRPGSLEGLKAAMNKIGITGMTVTNVMGYGMQKGKPEYYRGTPVEVTLLPKVQVDIVVSKVPVRQVIDTARAVLHTGHIGDGKIFVYDVENVVRVRTGEEGYDALQAD